MMGVEVDARRAMLHAVFRLHLPSPQQFTSHLDTGMNPNLPLSLLVLPTHALLHFRATIGCIVDSRSCLSWPPRPRYRRQISRWSSGSSLPFQAASNNTHTFFPRTSSGPYTMARISTVDSAGSGHGPLTRRTLFSMHEDSIC